MAGRDGKDSIVPGPAGRDGKDSIVPGPRGQTGIQGPQGLPGKDADVTALRQDVASLRATVDALLDMNKKAGEYIAWLHERRKRVSS